MKILVKTSYTNLETIEANAPSVGTFEESLCLVTPDSKRVGEPYFKICNNVSFTKADSIARISFLEPKYIEDHKDESGKVPYKLSSKQIQQMIRFFDKTNKLFGVTFWQFALYQYNKSYPFFTETGNKDGLRPLELTKFINGVYDTDEHLSHPNYLPSTLKRPDYQNLR